MKRAATCLVCCLLLGPLAAQDAPAAGVGAELDAKLDEGIAGAAGKVPVFVRMRDQVFPRGGDYEKFCAANEGKRRSDLRKRLLAELQSISRNSWEVIGPEVAELVEQGEVAGVARRWIVNGFFCEATADACRKLATRVDVAFVYRQRVEMQHATASRRRPAFQATAGDRRQALLAAALEGWRDDGKEPLATEGLTIPWNLQRVNAPAAWPHATGKGVVVAVLDTGLLVSPATATALWRNPREALDGKDDDGNGYVDDVFGWDFLAGDNCPLGDPRGHGTACAGIIAGRPAGEDDTVTGVAPRARLMPLRGTGRLEAYEYALANGADVLSLSYMWVNQPLGNYRGLYRLAHEHLAAAGIVAVGGAGNFARSAPKGQQIALPKDIPCVIAAAGVVESGGKGGPSSEGPCTWSGVWGYDDFPAGAPLLKPDVTGCFGGFPVWMPAGEQRGRVAPIEMVGEVALLVGPAGNSFAGPHAGGVAALVLSVAPELPAWSVKQILEATCKDLGAEGRDVVFGAGLLQADRAVEMAMLWATRPKK